MDSDKQRGIGRSSREFTRYDQVDKRQDYALSEGGRPEEFDDDYVIRTCDLRRWLTGDPAERNAFATELGSALADIGFAILTGHGIAPDIHRRAAEETLRVFTEHDVVTKRRFVARRHGSVNQGWFPLEETTDIHPDLVEGWVFGRRAFDLDPEQPIPVEDFWPDPRHERVLRQLVQAQEPLILPIMQSLMTYLGCDPGLYDQRLTSPSFALRLNHYPPITAEQDALGAGRLLGHEDTDLFTLLPAPLTEGLQVLNRRNFRWIRLDAPPGSIVLNVGDYLQRISNDRLPSTTHRVSKPRNPKLRGQARVSFPMNVYLKEDELLEVLPGLPDPRYPPIKVITFHTQTTAKYYGDDYAVDG